MINAFVASNNATAVDKCRRKWVPTGNAWQIASSIVRKMSAAMKTPQLNFALENLLPNGFEYTQNEVGRGGALPPVR